MKIIGLSYMNIILIVNGPLSCKSHVQDLLLFSDVSVDFICLMMDRSGTLSLFCSVWHFCICCIFIPLALHLTAWRRVCDGAAASFINLVSALCLQAVSSEAEHQQNANHWQKKHLNLPTCSALTSDYRILVEFPNAGSQISAVTTCNLVPTSKSSTVVI